MYNFLEETEKRKSYLEQLIDWINRQLKGMPKGHLRVSSGSFYHVTKKGDTSGRYIPITNVPLIAALAQKDYLCEVLKYARAELADISGRKIYTGKRLEEVYDGLHQLRKPFVKPVYTPDNLFAEEWASRPYERPGFDDNAPVFYTSDGLRVRSKIELIIAEKLRLYHITFLYEFPLELDGMLFHPDFTVLKMPERKVIYWEHLGMMDNNIYCINNVKKLNIFATGGIVSGDNLIITMESSAGPLNIAGLENIIRQNFLAK